MRAHPSVFLAAIILSCRLTIVRRVTYSHALLLTERMRTFGHGLLSFLSFMFACQQSLFCRGSDYHWGYENVTLEGTQYVPPESWFSYWNGTQQVGFAACGPSFASQVHRLSLFQAMILTVVASVTDRHFNNNRCGSPHCC